MRAILPFFNGACVNFFDLRVVLVCCVCVLCGFSDGDRSGASLWAPCSSQVVGLPECVRRGPQRQLGGGKTGHSGKTGRNQNFGVKRENIH